jgi:hypothetical protein
MPGGERQEGSRGVRFEVRDTRERDDRVTLAEIKSAR